MQPTVNLFLFIC